MYCTQCGTKNPDHAQFCMKCGAAVTRSQRESGLQDDGHDHTFTPARSWVPEPKPTTPRPQPVEALFRSPASLAGWLTAFLLMIMAVDSTLFITHIDRYRLGEEIATTQADPEWTVRASASDDRVSALSVAYLGAFVAAAAVWTMWLRRCYENLHSFEERNLRFSVAQATWCWYIPFVNIVRPYQVTYETLERTTHNGRTSLVGLWWAWNFFGGITANAVGKLPINNGQELQTSSLAWAFESLIALCSAFIAIMLVWRVTRAQQSRHAGELVIDNHLLDPGRAAYAGTLPPIWRGKSLGTAVGCPTCGATVRIGDPSCRYCLGLLPIAETAVEM
jgi:hypothetical protein